MTKRAVCKYARCKAPRWRKDWCIKHYAKWLRLIGRDGKTCGVDGCKRPMFVKGVCEAHYVAARRLIARIAQEAHP